MAALGVTDRGFLLGDGLFETIRIKNGEPLWMPAHLSRLITGAEILCFPPIQDDFAKQLADLIKVNEVVDGVARITVSRGEGQRGISLPETPIPTTLVAVSPAYPGRSPMSLHVVQGIRRNQFSPLFRIKSLNYLDNILARNEATQLGFDDAILLNTTGQVTETSVGNLLFLVDGKWVTPPVNDGVLPGTARARILADGLAKECTLQDCDLAKVESAIMVNALSLRTVEKIDQRELDMPEWEDEQAFCACLDL